MRTVFFRRLPILPRQPAVRPFGGPGEEGDNPSIQILLDSPLLAAAVPPAAEAFTFPADRPQYTLDYIFYTPATLELLAADVVSTAAQASDHLPVQAQVRLR